MKQPAISIVIPVYNVEKYIGECLDSIVAQTFGDWEAVCVDDGSTDSSGAILDSYSAKDPRIRVVHQPNAGVAAARNTGLKIARGEWIFFLDGDDLMLPGALESLSRAISPDVDLIRFRAATFEDGSPAPVPSGSGAWRDVDVQKRVGMEDFFAMLWAHIYRRSLIGGTAFKRYIRGEDRVFFAEIFLGRVAKVRVLDYLAYAYRQRPGSAMHSRPTAQVLRDEMDHRLEIAEMLDASGKMPSYKFDDWLELYFTRHMPCFIAERTDDRREVWRDWHARLRRLRRLKGISQHAKIVAALCPLAPHPAWDCAILRLADALLRLKTLLRGRGDFSRRGAEFKRRRDLRYF